MLSRPAKSALLSVRGTLSVPSVYIAESVRTGTAVLISGSVLTAAVASAPSTVPPSVFDVRVMCGLEPTVVSMRSACRLVISEPTKTCVAMPTAMPPMMSADCPGDLRKKWAAILNGSIAHAPVLRSPRSTARSGTSSSDHPEWPCAKAAPPAHMRT